MQHYNFLLGWAMKGSAQRCAKGQSLQHCPFSLHGGDSTPHPPYSHGDIQRDSPMKHVQTGPSDC